VGAKRKQHSADFKARVAMAALSGEKTLAELSLAAAVAPELAQWWQPTVAGYLGRVPQQDLSIDRPPDQALPRQSTWYIIGRPFYNGPRRRHSIGGRNLCQRSLSPWATLPTTPRGMPWPVAGASAQAV
jgi:hypothetical protein